MISQVKTRFRKTALKLSAAVFVGLASLAALPASAQGVPVYDTPSTTTGNQGYTDNLGLDFTVTTPIKVWGLGAFDDGSNGITGNVIVGIYDLAHLTWVTPQLNFATFAAAPGSGYAYQTFAPLILGPGSYSIVGSGFGPSDMNYNTNISGANGNSLITFDSVGGRLTNGNSRYGGGNAPASGTPFGFQSAFAGGTFLASSVPEPATWGMMLLGFGFAGGVLRSRRKGSAPAALA
jgi:hypothetical protein